MDLDIPALLNNGGIIALLSAFLAYFVNAYKNEVNDHKDTLKEMAMVRQKQDDVKKLVETWKSRKDIETSGGV